MPAISNPGRVEAAAGFIVDEMRQMLGIEPDSFEAPLRLRMAESCQAYKNGLTNCEARLAMLQALALLQIEVSKQLGKLRFYRDSGLDLDDDEAA